MKNSNLHNAKRAKNDEFYTQLADIEKELKHYTNHFKDKVVYCNCDDAEWSNFVKFFGLKFESLGLKKFISTSYNPNGHGKKMVIERDVNSDGKIDLGDLEIESLEGDGDFRSDESIDLLKEADIVVTNPPFSLFRDFVETLMKHEKKFLIIGSMNAITYKEVFKHIQAENLWLGNYLVKEFVNPEGEVKKFGNINWFTNLDHQKRNEEIICYKKYTKKDFPKYDNYNAIEVSKVSDIPLNYKGVMGVPITFLDKFNPKQFELLGCSYEYGKIKEHCDGEPYATILNGKTTYKRLFIKHKA